MGVVTGNKVKILGGVVVTISFVQAYPGLPAMLAPTTYAWVMLALGVLATFFGYLNTRQIRAEAYDQAMTDLRKEFFVVKDEEQKK